MKSGLATLRSSYFFKPVESPSALRLVDELKSSRSGPKGLQVERIVDESTCREPQGRATNGSPAFAGFVCSARRYLRIRWVICTLQRLLGSRFPDEIGIGCLIFILVYVHRFLTLNRELWNFEPE